MKQIKILLLLIISVKALNAQTILPTPEVFELNDGTYTFAQNVKVSVNKNSSVLPFLEEVLRTQGGRGMAISNHVKQADIVFTVDKSKPDEAYELNIKPERIIVTAAGDAGFFYAVQSIKQLLADSQSGQLPCVVIKDAPRYKLRSFLLEFGPSVSKNFYHKEISGYDGYA